MYKNMGVCIFSKLVMSVPGISRSMLYKTASDKGVHFSLFRKKDRDLYLKIKRSTFGGPSIIFRRVTRVGLTYIKENKNKFASL